MNKILLIILMAIILIGVSWHNNYLSKNKKEGYSNYTLEGATGQFPKNADTVLVQDTYHRKVPYTGISNLGANDIWPWYPVFPLGSYEQITNNIKYPDRPSNGTCTPASMCGALYDKTYTGDNVVKIEPPVNDNCGIRVGYFTSPVRDLVLPMKPDIYL